jgi:hypothetical protein
VSLSYELRCGGSQMLRGQTDLQSKPGRVDQAFRHDVVKGLSMRPGATPARWLYDRKGSALFEAISELPEYYPARIERSVLISWRILASTARSGGKLAGPGFPTSCSARCCQSGKITSTATIRKKQAATNPFTMSTDGFVEATL